MRVLVVEDEKTLRSLLERRFKEEKYSVDAAGDGREALDYINAGTYDCIVLDIMLPGRDGLSVLEEMRSRRGYPGTAGFGTPVQPGLAGGPVPPGRGYGYPAEPGGGTERPDCPHPRPDESGPQLPAG
ncbi:response regulator [Breznakiella homolactica]|uniref:Response regulator n=1 Tax=Breznakiella homolactica TaxID=2798577 RepID=A0A7T8B8R3_9SPIR|nr:response regulator [Breznakiella homolactica]